MYVHVHTGYEDNMYMYCTFTYRLYTCMYIQAMDIHVHVACTCTCMTTYMYIHKWLEITHVHVRVP